MERLTNVGHKEIGFCCYCGEKNPYTLPLTIGELAGLPEAEYSPLEILEEVFARLAAYEDTGLEPVEVKDLKDGICSGCSVPQLSDERRHIQDLLQAEKDGRLVVLPCKLTDTVYVVETVMKGKKHIGEKVVSAQIDHVTIGESGKPVLDVCTETGNWYGPLEAGEFYLTSQEAEEELRKEGENG